MKESSDVLVASKIIIEAFKRGNKLLIFGNGGSAAQAQHMASELVWRLYKERRALPAIALTDIVTLTAIANDLKYDFVFSRQIEALGYVGDVALGMTTSGCSENILIGLIAAKRMGLHTILLNYPRNSRILVTHDIEFDFISPDTATAQEAHLKIIHTMCDMIEKEFLDEASTMSSD